MNWEYNGVTTLSTIGCIRLIYSPCRQYRSAAVDMKMIRNNSNDYWLYGVLDSEMTEIYVWLGYGQGWLDHYVLNNRTHNGQVLYSS